MLCTLSMFQYIQISIMFNCHLCTQTQHSQIRLLNVKSILSHLLNFETKLHSVLKISGCGSYISQMERMSNRVNSSVCHQGVSLFINRLEGITSRKWQDGFVTDCVTHWSKFFGKDHRATVCHTITMYWWSIFKEAILNYAALSYYAD